MNFIEFSLSVGRLSARKRNVHLVDGFPVPVCHFRRANFSQVFRGEATFGYCASKHQTYYGFKAMLLTSGEGVIEDHCPVCGSCGRTR